MTRTRSILHIAATLLLTATAVHSPSAFALGEKSHVASTPTPGSFPLATTATAAPLYVDTTDWPGVLHAVSNLASDINQVTSHTPESSTPSQSNKTSSSSEPSAAAPSSTSSSPNTNSTSARSAATGRPPSHKQFPTHSPALAAHWSSQAPTSAAPSSPSTISPSRSASLPGPGGPMSPFAIRTRSTSHPAVTSSPNPA